MSLTQEIAFGCPYCMAPNSLDVDPIHDIEQQFIVDCQICCQPIEMTVSEEAGELHIQPRTADE